jgi:CheY-like chemotaxis protein
MRCLLVDDEPGIREGLAVLLRRRGHEVHTAGDCAAARQSLEHASYDVVVTDWRLPDGLAAGFVPACRAPVIAVSGHPEEIARDGRIRDVLAKPVTPGSLLAAIAACVAEAASEQPAALPCDVQEVIEDVLAQLPPELPVECHDDGTFVVLRIALPPGCVPMVRNLGGDLRVAGPAGDRSLELRLCRDGRPDADMPAVRADADWPEHDRLSRRRHAGQVLDEQGAVEVDQHRLHLARQPREGVARNARAPPRPLRGQEGGEGRALRIERLRRHRPLAPQQHRPPPEPHLLRRARPVSRLPAQDLDE